MIKLNRHVNFARSLSSKRDLLVRDVWAAPPQSSSAQRSGRYFRLRAVVKDLHVDSMNLRTAAARLSTFGSRGRTPARPIRQELRMPSLHLPAHLATGAVLTCCIMVGHRWTSVRSERRLATGLLSSKTLMVCSLHVNPDDCALLHE